MNSTMYTYGHSAVADAPHRPDLGANAAYFALDGAMHRDARAQTRVDAAIGVQVRTELGERPACIRNLSPRGLMISMARPPRRGEFVEIVTGMRSLIGQVKWANDCNAGIALRDIVDVRSVIRGERGPVAAKRPEPRKSVTRPSASTISQNSHIIARQLQFAAILAFGVCAALLIALGVHDMLTEVFDQVKTGLPG